MLVIQISLVQGDPSLFLSAMAHGTFGEEFCLDHFASLVEFILINLTDSVVSMTAGQHQQGRRSFVPMARKSSAPPQFPTRAGWEGIALQSRVRFEEGKPSITVPITLSAYL